MKQVSDKKLQESIGFTPFDAQEEIINSPSQERVIVCGRKFGKTLVAAYIALKTLILPEKKVWVVAPSYELTTLVIEAVLPWLNKLFGGSQFRYSKRPHPKITTAWGSELRGKSADTIQGLLGDEIDLLIMDEAAFINEDVYEKYIYQNLIERNGDAVFISTPRGKNWLYDRWLKAKKTGGAFQFPSNARPNFPKKVWEQKKQELPKDIFAEMYEAKFEEGTTAVFYKADIEKAVREYVSIPPTEGGKYILGVDLAKSNDYSVITVVDRRNNQVVYIEKSSLEKYTQQEARIIAVSEKYNNAAVWIDASGPGDPVYDHLFEKGLFIEPYKFNKKTKVPLINNLRLLFEFNSIIIPNNKELLQELEEFEKSYDKARNYTYSAPQGKHDDMVISLALAAWELTTKQAKFKNEFHQQLEEGARRRRRVSNRSFV